MTMKTYKCNQCFKIWKEKADETFANWCNSCYTFSGQLTNNIEQATTNISVFLPDDLKGWHERTKKYIIIDKN